MFADAGEEVEVATLRGISESASLPPPLSMGGADARGGGVVNFRIHRLRSVIRTKIAGLPLGLIRLVRKDFDVIHLHFPFFGAQELLVLMMWFGWKPRRLVVTYHMDIVASGFVKIVATMSRRFFLPTIIRRADAIIVSSKSYAETSWLKDMWEFVSQKLFEIPLSVDTTVFFSVVKNMVHENNVTSMLFVATLDRPHYFKGLSLLFRAISSLKERNDWVLNVVGDGELREGYENEVKSLGIEHRVKFLGRVSDEELPKIFRDANLHIVASIDRSEAFGLVTIQAQASGVPSIVPDLPGVMSTVEDGVTGFVFKTGNENMLATTIEKALDNYSLVVQMGSEARLRAIRLFGKHAHLNNLKAVYEINKPDLRYK